METEAVDLKLAGMTCAACAARIEKVLNRVDGVRADVNFATESAHVEFDRAKATTDALIAAVRNAGYDAKPAVDPFTQPDDEAKAEAQRYRRELAVFVVSAALTLPFVVQMVAMALGDMRSKCRSRFSSRSRRRSSSGRARGSTPARGRRCAAALRTWMC
jgi:cation transport ATPase